MGMSGSERFDIATGILSVLVLAFALLERALPRTRLKQLDKSLKHAQADLDTLREEGLVAGHATNFFERLDGLRQQSDRLAARVHTASSIYLQLKEMCIGLSCRLSGVHRRVLNLQADIVSWKVDAVTSKQAGQSARSGAGTPESLSTSRPRDDRKSRSRPRRSSASSSSRPYISRSSSKIFMMSSSASRRSSSSTTLSAANNRPNLTAPGMLHPLTKYSHTHRSNSVPGPHPIGDVTETRLPRAGSLQNHPLNIVPDLSIIPEDVRTEKGGRSSTATTSRGRRLSRSGMFYVPS